MSYIGRKAIYYPENIQFVCHSNYICVKGPLGQLTVTHHGYVVCKFNLVKSVLYLSPNYLYGNCKEQWGRVARDIQNAIIGVTIGYTIKLDLVGVGFKIEIIEGLNGLILRLGFAHNHVLFCEKDVVFSLETSTRLVLFGINKFKVGWVASRIRNIYCPEVYKGKGIRYSNERVVVRGKK